MDALCDIGLGYLDLGQASTTLSGGEAQRVKLARYLGKKSLARDMLILDEPTTGLHPQDLAGLLVVLDRLVRAGATVVVVEHNTDVIRAADWVIDLGPGAGSAGGQMLFAGAPEGLVDCSRSLTGKALREERHLTPTPLSHASTEDAWRSISIRGARVHNLQNVSVEIPKGKLTVVSGLSGSGKSSLVHDVLEAEARRRFLESLSLYERQGLHEGAEAEVEAVTGLGVALTIGAERLVYSRRATVGTATEISHYLDVLLSSQGERQCLVCGSPMERGMEWICGNCGASAPLAAARHFTSTTYAAACQKCNGVGSLQMPNPAKLIIHPEKPLVEGAMYSPGFFPNGYLGKPFNGGYYMLLALAEQYGFDPHQTPWNQISAEAQQAFLFGSKMELTITYTNRAGRSNTYQAKFPGFYGFIRDWDIGGTYSDNQPCPACAGARLRPEYLAVRLGGSNIYQLEQMTLVELASRLAEIQPARREMESVLQTIHRRMGFLIQVGLGYLNLGRTAGTLSAGEAQRIRLASLLGSGLTALTVLLDEPTRGLHPTEVDALLLALESLRDEGNTVIVVEHDPQVIRSADHLIDMGPGAGNNGGQIVAQGTPEQIALGDSLTGLWLRGERRMQAHKRRSPQAWLRVHGARANNLKGEMISIPLGVLAGVCGVSGSGKSTLVVDTLGRALAPKKQTTSVAYEPVEPGEHDFIEGAPARTIVVDQSKAGLSSPATFLDLAHPIQAIYAASPEAQIRGLDERRLAERCSVCDGRGRLTLDMTFLPDVHVPCETCRGSGYTAEAWEVRLHGLALPEVFGQTIDEVYRLFGDEPRLQRQLQAAREVGLGYLVLRQPGYALSGGEAQRLKIASELCRKSVSGSFYILDEPSIGQHLEDVLRLTAVLHRLVDEGGSVLIVEHHTGLLAACDWLLELGPGGGPGGGHVIASGHAGAGSRRKHADGSLSTEAAMTWLPLLLADPSACLRWLVLRDLFGRPAGDPELAELDGLRQLDPQVSDLLRLQNTDGSWHTGVLAVRGRTGSRVLMTAFAMARLGYWGFDASHPAVRRGADYLFSQQQGDGSWPLTEEAALTDSSSQIPANERYSMIPLQTAFPLRGLAACGYATDPRSERAYEWLLAQRLQDGAWPTGIAAGVYGGVAAYRRLAHSRWGCRSNTTAALMCLALHPVRCKSEPARHALDLLLERETRELTSLGLEVARLVGAEPAHGFFTYFARFDLALLLDLCGRVGISQAEPRAADLLAFIRSHQGKYGLWESADWPQAARWLTFDLLRSLKRFNNQEFIQCNDV